MSKKNRNNRHDREMKQLIHDQQRDMITQLAVLPLVVHNITLLIMNQLFHFPIMVIVVILLTHRFLPPFRLRPRSSRTLRRLHLPAVSAGGRGTSQYQMRIWGWRLR